MRAGLLIFVFLAGLASATAGLRRVAALNTSESGGRLEHLAAHRDDYNLIVVGPSFTRLHFIPPLFDERMKERGYDVHSFGFGMSALRGGELDYYLERILDLQLPNLKWVICDVTLNQKKAIEPKNAFKRRVIYWNEPEPAALTLEAIASKARDSVERTSQIWLQARHVLMKLASVGEGVESLREGSWYGHQRKVEPLSAFYVTPAVGRMVAPKAASYLKHNKKSHLRHVKTLTRDRKTKKPRDNELLQRWRDRMALSGVEPWFLISPVLSFSRFEKRVPNGESLRMLDFNDPVKYPELYEPSLHYDPSHFHYGGAMLFTREMADTFADALDENAKKKTR